MGMMCSKALIGTFLILSTKQRLVLEHLQTDPFEKLGIQIVTVELYTLFGLCFDIN